MFLRGHRVETCRPQRHRIIVRDAKQGFIVYDASGKACLVAERRDRRKLPIKGMANMWISFGWDDEEIEAEIRVIQHGFCEKIIFGNEERGDFDCHFEETAEKRYIGGLDLSAG